MIGAGGDSSEVEHTNSIWGVLDLNPHTVKEKSLVDGLMHILISYYCSDYGLGEGAAEFLAPPKYWVWWHKSVTPDLVEVKAGG